MPARAQRSHTEAWHEIQQYCLWPEQQAYELVRPIVLFGDTPAARAAQPGAVGRHSMTGRFQGETGKLEDPEGAAR